VLRLNARGQTTLEVLLIAILAFILVGAIVGTNRSDGGGIPATMRRAAPRLAGEMERRLETGGGFGGEKSGYPEPVSWQGRLQK